MRRAAAVLATALAGCAPLTDRVVLLPGSDGAATGAVTVKAANGEVVLAEPYAAADVAGGEPRRTQSSAAEVQQAYGTLLAAQPPRPRRFVLNFETGGDRLTAESEPILAQLRSALAATPGSHQTGSIAVFVTTAEPFASRTRPSATSRPAAIAPCTSGMSMCALVTAIVGRMS